MIIDGKIRLQATAYEVRQLALGPQGDLQGWRLARLMRDATTLPQVITAERQLGWWLRTRGLSLA